jgi:hypothetical protein
VRSLYSFALTLLVYLAMLIWWKLNGWHDFAGK